MTQAKTALVTGGGGFLGNAIVRLLVDQGVKVRSFSRKFHPALVPMEVEQIQGDLRDADNVRDACQNMEVVFHTAAKAGVGVCYRDYYQTNVIGTRNVIDASRKCGVSRLIYTSSPSVVFNGGNMEGVNESIPYSSSFHAHYPKTKAMAEKMVIEAADDGLPAIALRPHLIWGPGDNHLVPSILGRASKLRQVGDGTNRVDTIYIDNAARAHILADQALAGNPNLSGRIYFVSQDDPVLLWEMVNRILHAGGLPPVIKTISPALAFGVGQVCEWIYSLMRIDGNPPMTRFMAQELSASHWFDISAAKRDLGYEPLVSTKEGLRRLAKWLGSQ